MTELCKDKAEMFKQRANFPHCIRAIDGKNIQIVKPTGTRSQHFNCKHYFSMGVLTIVDTNYKFLCIDVELQKRL